MASNKTIAVLVASSVLALFTLSTVVNAESIVKEEQDQLGNSPSPDVDPGASKGTDKPIPDQERMQLGNEPGPDVQEPSSANKKGGDSIPELEQKDLEN